MTEPLVVAEPVSFHGIAAAGAVVRAGGHLNLHGVLDGDLEVQPGGRANIYGIVTGEVRNGGIVIVSGIVRGRVHEGSLGAPVTVVGSGSWVNGVEHLDQDESAADPR